MKTQEKTDRWLIFRGIPAGLGKFARQLPDRAADRVAQIANSFPRWLGCARNPAHLQDRKKLQPGGKISDTSTASETLEIRRPAPRGAFRKSEAEFYPESSASLAFEPSNDLEDLA